ncbi:hypothetical protein OCU04_003465 [Sclerotinia nivalis]|uniref:Uncharacterized protein n=1 Tax=Sclerotinia nivalis TaxID=352851 RepID=A0A9X0DPB4_9HELO|nr:hypothetical protein OCU04_003465 [Sclerotinia nivalis]
MTHHIVLQVLNVSGTVFGAKWLVQVSATWSVFKQLQDVKLCSIVYLLLHGLPGVVVLELLKIGLLKIGLLKIGLLKIGLLKIGIELYQSTTGPSIVLRWQGGMLGILSSHNDISFVKSLSLLSKYFYT